MATIIRTSRGNLALSPPREVDDMHSDSSTSPHFNTLRSSLDKTKSPEVAVATVPDADVVITASRRSSSNASSGGDADKVLWEEKMSEERRGREEGVFASDDYDDQDDDECPPATEAKDVHGSTNHIETKDDEEESIDLDDNTGDAPSQDRQRTTSSLSASNDSIPNMPLHRRIPSSSIPHLMSRQSSTDPDAPFFQDQFRLSFVGIDGALPFPADQLDESYTSSADGINDAELKGVGNNHTISVSPYNRCGNPSNSLQAIQTGCYQQNMMNFNQANSSYESNANTPPTSALASFATPYHTPNQNMRDVNTPPHILGVTTLSPPYIVPLPMYQQGLQSNATLPQQQLPVIVDSSQVVSLEHTTNTTVYSSTNESILTSNIQPTAAVTSATQTSVVPTKQVVPSHQNQYRSTRQSVQPVLYSAINSLERYNAGSFDNKVIMAKARRKQAKAFPGVPFKNIPKSSESLDSASESKESSISSHQIARRPGEDCSKSKSTASHDATFVGINIATTESSDSAQAMGQGGDHAVPTKRYSNEEKFVKSHSSGNLVDEGMAQSKGRRKGTTDNRSVTIIEDKKPKRGKRRERKEKKVGVFRPSCDAYTPRMGQHHIKYKPAEERNSVEQMSSTMGTIQRPNFRDALRRVAIILHQHIVKIEHRFETGVRGVDDTGLFKSSMRDLFSEDNFATPRYKCSMVRVPMARPGVVYSMRKIRVVYNTPSTDEIYEFAHQLFKKVQLSSECSIVCLIYVEKLMEVAKVPLVRSTWRPIFMCGLLLASKVWQDLSSWNIEFAGVYPQFSLDAINRLEVQFLKCIKWDLYISSSLYAKYYFALRSLLEKSGFRDRYNQMVGGLGGIAASEAMKVAKRSEAVKEEALLQLSRSM